MSVEEYYQCDGCKTIFAMPHVSGAKLSNPNPCCDYESNNSDLPITRTQWPSVNFSHVFRLVKENNTEDFNKRRISIVFLCSALEEMLLTLGYRILSSYIASSHMADEVILKKYQGRENLITLFNKLNKVKISEILNNNDMKTFLGDWSNVVKARNQIAHGNFFYTPSSSVEVLLSGVEEIELISRTVDSTLKAFALIHNNVDPLEKFDIQKVID